VFSLKEAALAVLLEVFLTKRDILELYFNRVYLSGGIYGVETMSEKMLRKPASQLTLGEAALIAGIIQAPASFSPWTHFDAARRRSFLVLQRMREENKITEVQETQARYDTVLTKEVAAVSTLALRRAQYQELTGADALAARMLTMWRMPACGAGCSQAVVPGQEPLLVRNYDYDPQLFEGVVASTNYSGQRRVIGTSDLLWGLLDGMNEDGLAVSLTLGGRAGSGEGFGIPIVLRYVLETCSDTESAVAVLSRIPVAQAYNISIVDTAGGHATVYVAPGEPAEVSDLQAATNHRLTVVEHPHISDPLHSRQRQYTLFDALSDLDPGGSSSELVDAFTRRPLRTGAYDRGFGTLYTAAYRPADGTVTYLWPGRSWTRHFDDDEAHIDVHLSSEVDDD